MHSPPLQSHSMAHMQVGCITDSFISPAEERAYAFSVKEVKNQRRKVSLRTCSCSDMLGAISAL